MAEETLEDQVRQLQTDYEALARRVDAIENARKETDYEALARRVDAIENARKEEKHKDTINDLKARSHGL